MRSDSRGLQRDWCRTLFFSVLCVTVAACEDGVPPGPRASFSGRFELRTVDGVVLPTPIQVNAGGGATMEVQSGQLLFGGGNQLSVGATGPLVAGGTAVTLSEVGVYLKVGEDSLQTTVGVLGRVWGDSAEVRTGSLTTFGDHVWLYVRPATP